MYRKQSLPSVQLATLIPNAKPQKGKKKFLEEFDIIDDGQRFEAISKNQYFHTLPDGRSIPFKYYVVGLDAENTVELVPGLDSVLDVVEADSLQFYAVPSNPEFIKNILQNDIREYEGHDLDNLSSRELVRYAVLSIDNHLACIFLGEILYPAITLDDVRGSFTHPTSKHFVMWPLELLDDFAECVPALEENFQQILEYASTWYHRPVYLSD